MNNYLGKILLAFSALVTGYFVISKLFVIQNTEIVSGLFTLVLLACIILFSKQHAEEMGNEQ